MPAGEGGSCKERRDQQGDNEPRSLWSDDPSCVRAGLSYMNSHFTLLSQPASQAAVTYIAKHSRAKGINPR